MFESVTSLIGDSLVRQLILLGYIIGTLVVFGIVIYFASALWTRKKNSQRLTSEQNNILRYGRMFAGTRRLRHLYLKSPAGKAINVGDIKAVVITQDDKGDFDQSVIGVRKDFKSAFDFYLIKFSEEHLKWNGDIFIDEWNFVKSGDDMFMIPNTNEYFKYVPAQSKTNFSVDTLKTLQLAVQASILANAYHRIKVREKKLIKNPEEMN